VYEDAEEECGKDSATVACSDEVILPTIIVKIPGKDGTSADRFRITAFLHSEVYSGRVGVGAEGRA
jgi:hypothetical protein